MSSDILDILGVATKEETYTSLIAYALANHTAFRKAAIEKFLGKPCVSDDWKIKSELQVASCQGKDIPDIVIYSSSENRIIIVENKLFSAEGLDQTTRYSSSEFNDAIKNLLGLPNAGLDYIFLTLENRQPQSSKFKKISYSELAKVIPQSSINNSKLCLLLDEFRKKVEEFDKCAPPQPNQVFLDYLKSNPVAGLVSSYRKFEVACTHFSRNVGSQLGSPDIGTTSHLGSGYIPLAVWRKEGWLGKEYSEGDRDGRKCYDIHYEFQWDARNDTLTLYLHYHTNPYMTQTELEQIDKDFVKSHLEGRNKFYDELRKAQKSLPNWQLRKTILQLAYYPFDKNIKYGDLGKKLEELFGDMTSLVDNAIKII